MEMNLTKIFEMQKVLDTRIIMEHGLEGVNLFYNMILALQVEIGELANETRCFKHWSNKGPSEKEVILMEYVDGLHFIASLGNGIGFNPNEYSAEFLKHNANVFSASSLVSQFNNVYEAVSEFRATQDRELYEELLYSYLGLGKKLGFTFEEIEQGYYKKNEVNHQRQTNGY
ncbi:dUTP diphosphatase [Bacillus thuringiensis]|uniref:dUTPase n=1 Tax=Bacillus thuringiensis HD-771 TaxID=1218175 RepID=A0A9W3JF87_BACTU|nr:dUTP diphosphatase [Bacillus thuringiensis]AFQ14932.1 dUTPase [Bacillus thuringiensis HD-771]MEC2474824.1 dUTP diphosphatase [Bacillus thuringiensis]MEC3221982.1 dUTP diphosphatase [Bacillus thuringiensis]MEC3269006.1 dUTP diphosphatase [Bacillus thuringiensis]MEC3465433.1 dUTP diphosphatase [Bacillus thuringiensis]